MQLHNIPIFSDLKSPPLCFCCFVLDLKRCLYGSSKDLTVIFFIYFVWFLSSLFISLLSSFASTIILSLSISSSSFSSDLPAGPKERSGKLHQEALHQVHLPHGILPDLPLPPAAGLATHRPHQPAHAGTPTHDRGVDDSPMGAGYVQVNMTFCTGCTGFISREICARVCGWVDVNISYYILCCLS